MFISTLRSRRPLTYFCVRFSGFAQQVSFLTYLHRSVSMLHFPDCVHKAQAEIDSVVGQARMPSFEDETSLPYVRAYIKEMMRYDYDDLIVCHCLTMNVGGVSWLRWRCLIRVQMKIITRAITFQRAALSFLTSCGPRFSSFHQQIINDVCHLGI